MILRNPSATPAQQLKEWRVRLGLTTREVQAKSEQIAEERHNREYYISHSWVTDIEKGKLNPAMYKLYSLSAIYRVPFIDILGAFGMSIADLGRYQTTMGAPRTHLLLGPSELEASTVPVPVEFKADFDLDKTDLLARAVKKWEQFPVALLQQPDLRKCVYGYVGLKDFTLDPLIRPGSLVRIDPEERKVSSERWQTEYDRPVYFVELRDGYLCSWCEVDRGLLTIVPHPHSHQEVRRFEYPRDAEIVGRVTEVSQRIVKHPQTSAGETR
jgi:transcriptional regulator with XRE-family HTH domain